MLLQIKAKLHAKFTQDRFLKNVTVLVGGNIAAQMIVICASPLLTRLYTPDEFGYLGLFISLLALLASISSLQYESTITLPKDDLDGANIVLLCFVTLLGVVLLTAGSLLIFTEQIAELFQVEAIKNYLFLLPISLLALGGNNILNSWATRKKNYGLISTTKITQGINMTLVQVIGGMVIKGPLGLMIGDVIGRAGGNARFIRSTYREDWQIFKQIKWKKIMKMAKRYKKFPIYSSPATLFRQVSLELPFLVLTGIYGPSIGGGFILVQRVLGLPLFLIGLSIGNVYLSDASKLVHINPDQIKKLFWSTFQKLFIIIAPLLFIIIIFGPTMFTFIFGNDWTISSSYLPILAIMYSFQFLSAPLGVTLYVLERNDLQILREIIRVVLIGGALILAYIFSYTPFQAIIAISVAGSIGFILYGIFSIVAIHQYLQQQGIPVKGETPI
ncbi:O-antigen/teichoic acid export membrane protein [Bacillus mesophilus]|uniref:Oligosaccharide flippase family protein n=1 Tax=Bacillus mesophilus TaxID=1808955 RepID=A0A6M0Q7I9_9BACI|nr:oligosaccharide flippase family protein [Bacillus mesophilus]MBM7661626.1 O-antigen/teichoic acid export membrane protein [Bacillus mesophilus]NEY72294.1 oligosaccharide flippase family protein [Bacillus mesophilus]